MTLPEALTDEAVWPLAFGSSELAAHFCGTFMLTCAFPAEHHMSKAFMMSATARQNAWQVCGTGIHKEALQCGLERRQPDLPVHGLQAAPSCLQAHQVQGKSVVDHDAWLHHWHLQTARVRLLSCGSSHRLQHQPDSLVN